MPISHENYNIDKINHGGAPDIIWCAKMIMRLKIDYTQNQRNVFLNLIRDLGMDPESNPNLFAIDFGDGFGVQYLNNLNIDYEFRNNIKDTYDITLYSTDNKIIYYPVDSYKDNLHFKVDNIKFNYNPEIKPSRNYTKKFRSKSNNIDPIQNDVIPHNAEDIYVVYHDQDIVFGSKIDADELIYEIEITDTNSPVRLINPLSHPRFSWERLKHNVEITWGDGYITKLYDYYINTGRFNRYSSIILQHKYDNVEIGQKFIIKIKSKEPLAPIGCKLLKIDGSFPIDNYLVMDKKFGSNIVGLFGECDHEDYPEISLLSKHRNTITTIGKYVCKNYLNTSMKNHFKDFIKLTRIENGFFDSLLGYCVDYTSCFENNLELTYVPKTLLGYINNIVIQIDSMFKNTPLLSESLELRKSLTLISSDSIYHNSGITKLYDDFLYECPNWKYANNICYNASKLEYVSLNQFKYSNQLEEMQNGFMNTQITIPFYLQDKKKLWNINSIFRNIKTLIELKVNMFTNLGLEASKDVDINYIFKDSGVNDGCVVPNEFFTSLKNVKSFTDIIDGIMENFNIKGKDFPSQLFNGVFHVNKPKTYLLLNPFKGIHFSENEVQFLNKIFVGDNTNLIGIEGFIRNIVNPIAYIKKDILSELPDLKQINNCFTGSIINCIFPEEFLLYQRKLSSAIGMFESVQYKYNHFPIDYLIRTDMTNIDLTDFFKNSNIKTYKLIHWSTNKSITVNATNIVDANSQTVPVSFITDNRSLNPSISIDFKKSTIQFLAIANANSTITFEGINPTENTIINWGDDSESTINATNNSVTHTYQSKGVYLIKYTSKYAIIPTSRNNVNFMEIKGEFPFNSIPSQYLNEIDLGSPGYIDSIFHIANSEYTHKFKITPNYINPYYLKYAVNMKRCDMFASNQRYNILSIMPSKFYQNCVGLEDFSNTLNVSARVIPDDIFPENLINSTYQKNNLWIGKYQDNLIFRNKQIISNKLFKSYMNDDVCPFGTSWQTKPFNTNLKEFTTQVNTPLDEYLGFVINKNVTNLGLKRIVEGTDEIGNIRIEIFSSEVQINKNLNITSDDQLLNCIGNITIDSDIGFAYIRVYSKIPLWITNIDAITELRGVIPPCILLTSMQELAPNLEWYSETLLSRLENTSFRGFMANLPYLRYIHRGTFARNINASDFESCFENDISLLEIPDYLIHSKNFDINCSKMFKGCVNIKYVYRPIDDSVRGRINVTEMFEGVKTVAFNSSDLDSQLFDKLWYIGTSGLTQHTSTLQRPTIELPTVAGWTNGYGIDLDSFTNSVYFEGSEIISVLNNSNYNADILKYAQSRMINTSNDDVLIKNTLQVSNYINKLKYLPCVSVLNFKDEAWYSNEESDPKIFQTFNPKLFMYNENLLSIRNGFSQSEIITPINSMFLKFNSIINSLYGFAKYTWIRHKDDIGKSARLGFDHLGWIFLGVNSMQIPLELSSFLNSDLECLVDITDMFYSTRINLETDKFSLGFMYPQLLVRAFANDTNLEHERDRGILVSDNLIKNIYSHNSDTTKAQLSDQYANITSLFDGNIHNTTGTILADRITSKAVIISNGLNNLFRNSYVSLKNYNPNFLVESNLLKPISIDGLFENTNIDKLPILPTGVNTMKKSFKNCKNIIEKIPENYIKTDHVDATEAFSGSSAIIEDRITTAKSIIVDDMLKNCVSSINEDHIFTSWSGDSKVISPDNRYAINNPKIFVQIIDLYPLTSLYKLDSLTNIKNEDDRYKPFKVDFGDGVIQNVTLDNFEYHYKKSGIYKITFYLEDVNFVPYIPSVRTLSLSRLPISDFHDYKDPTFKLSNIFGSNLQCIEDYFFKNVTNINKLTTLSLCSGLSDLISDPIVITEDMTALTDLSYYYNLVKFSNINDIPLNIKHQIENMFCFAMESNINITENYIKDFINVKNMGLFAYKSTGYITSKLIQNKAKLVEIRGLLTDSKVEITAEYNNFFVGTQLKAAVMCFQGCTIREFPTEIIKHTQLKAVDRLFAMGTIEDVIFAIPEDFFPQTIESTYKCFTQRPTLVDYHPKVFANKPNLNNVTGTFSYTGIKHIKKHTICSEVKEFRANELFAYTHPSIIDDEIVVKWDSRYLDITSILDGVIYNKPFNQIIGRAIKYICTENTYQYYKPQYNLNLNIDIPTIISLRNVKDLQFPLNLDMHIDYGDGYSIYIDYINSVDELLYKTRHQYQIADNYTIKVMGELVVELEIQK